MHADNTASCFSTASATSELNKLCMENDCFESCVASLTASVNAMRRQRSNPQAYVLSAAFESLRDGHVC